MSVACDLPTDNLSSLGAGGLDEYTLSMQVVNGAAYATVLADPRF